MLKFIVGLTGEFYKANTTVYVHILFNCRCLNNFILNPIQHLSVNENIIHFISLLYKVILTRARLGSRMYIVE